MAGIDAHFVAATGSITGREHIRLQRNNQDGVALYRAPDLLALAVADGCSSGRYSEVGAQLAVHWFAQNARRYLDRLDQPEAFAEAVLEGLVDLLASVGRRLSDDETLWPGLVRDFLLSTFQAAVISPVRVVVFGMGDGVVSVNGDVTVLDAGPANTPLYPAYRLVGASRLDLSACLRPRVHHAGPTAALESLLLGTDGLEDLIASAGSTLRDGSPAGGLEQFERDERYLRNSSLVQKRLVVLGEVNLRLRDDTSMVLVRRRPTLSDEVTTGTAPDTRELRSVPRRPSPEPVDGPCSQELPDGPRSQELPGGPRSQELPGGSPSGQSREAAERELYVWRRWGAEELES